MGRSSSKGRSGCYEGEIKFQPSQRLLHAQLLDDFCFCDSWSDPMESCEHRVDDASRGLSKIVQLGFGLYGTESLQDFSRVNECGTWHFSAQNFPGSYRPELEFQRDPWRNKTSALEIFRCHSRRFARRPRHGGDSFGPDRKNLNAPTLVPAADVEGQIFAALYVAQY